MGKSKKNKQQQQADADDVPVKEKTGRSSKKKGSGSSSSNEVQRAIRRATPPVHIWMSHIADDDVSSAPMSANQNRGRGATKANARAKGEDLTSGNSSFLVCSQNFFEPRNICMDKKCKRNHDIRPIHECVMADCPIPRPKKNPKSLNVQFYTCLADVDEVRSFKTSNDTVVYASTNNLLLYSPEDGLNISALDPASSLSEAPPTSAFSLSAPMGGDVQPPPADLENKLPASAIALFAILPDETLLHLFTTFLPLPSYAMFAMTCKTFMSRMYSQAAIADLFVFHRWTVPPPRTSILPILQAHLTHKRNFSVFDPSASSKLLRKNTHVLTPATSTHLRSDPIRMFNSIVHPNNSHALTLRPPTSIAVHELGKPQAVQIVRAAPYKRDMFITGFCCTPSFLFTASSGDVDLNFITVSPLETFLAGEGVGKKDDPSAVVHSFTDLLGNEGNDAGHRFFHDGLTTFKCHHKNYLVVPVVQNDKLQLSIFAIGRDGTIEPVRNLMLHEDREDIEIPQGDEYSNLFMCNLGNGCLSICMEVLEEEEDEVEDEDEGGAGGEEGEDAEGGDDGEGEEEGGGNNGEVIGEEESSNNEISEKKVVQTYHIFYDVSSRSPSDWCLLTTPPPIPPAEVPCSLSSDPTGQYSISRNKEYEWSLKYQDEALYTFTYPEPLFFDIRPDSITLNSNDKFIFIKASSLVEASEDEQGGAGSPATKKKPKKGGGRMAKDAGTKGMKLKMRKRC